MNISTEAQLAFIKKLKSGHVTLALLVFILVFVFNASSNYQQTKNIKSMAEGFNTMQNSLVEMNNSVIGMKSSIDLNSKVLMLQTSEDINILDYYSARASIKNILMVSKGSIMDWVDRTLRENNIHNPARREIIERDLRNYIEQLYTADKNQADRLYFGTFCLGELWQRADLSTIQSLVIGTIYSGENDHDMIRRDMNIEIGRAHV